MFLAGAALLWLNRRDDRKLAMLSGLLLSSPCLWILICLFVEQEPGARAEGLLALWPFLLIVSFILRS